VASTNGIQADRRRFDTTSLWTRAAAENGAGAGPPPPAVSARAYLRASLPQMYKDDDFGLRFIGALETLLDPVVGLLDALPAHLDPDLGPPDILALTALWLGMQLDGRSPPEHWRGLLHEGPQLGRRHGTRAGFELGLRIAFPTLSLRVEDDGGVVAGSNAEELAADPPGGLVVYSDAPLSDAEAGAVARTIEQLKPVTVAYKLRVATAPGDGADEPPGSER
jgi:phage tail-like protein